MARLAVEEEGTGGGPSRCHQSINGCGEALDPIPPSPLRLSAASPLPER